MVLDVKPCLTGMGADISRLHEAEEALRESERRYRTLVVTSEGGKGTTFHVYLPIALQHHQVGDD